MINIDEAKDLDSKLENEAKKREEEKERIKREKELEIQLKREARDKAAEEKRLKALKLEEERNRKIEERELAASKNSTSSHKRKQSIEEGNQKTSSSAKASESDKRVKTVDETPTQDYQQQSQQVSSIPAVNQLLEGSSNSILPHDLKLIEEFFVGRYCTSCFNV